MTDGGVELERRDEQAPARSGTQARDGLIFEIAGRSDVGEKRFHLFVNRVVFVFARAHDDFSVPSFMRSLSIFNPRDSSPRSEPLDSASCRLIVS